MSRSVSVMITACWSPLMMAQKTQVAGISREPTVPGGWRRGQARDAKRPAASGCDLEPDAGADGLTEEPPPLRELVDQLEPAATLVVSAYLTPVRQTGAAVVDDVDVDNHPAACDRDRDPLGVAGVLDRVGHQFAGQQLGVVRGGVPGQRIPDEP